MDTIGAGIPLAQADPLFKPVGKQELTSSDFMTLFITQLQHQDPMEPMDSSDMATQLADFSNMEATMRMADSMDQLLEYQTSQNNLQLLTLLDQEVRVYGNGIGVTGDEIGKGEFNLNKDADMAVLEIRDAGNKLVKLIDLGALSMGDHDVEWDGTDMQGNKVEDGLYVFDVKAYDQAGQQLTADYKATGKVTGIDYETGSAMLVLDHYVPVNVGAVVSVI
ncbi:MAG: flagellar hook assembly protein FlgD [Proteobacteria bacterium]|nr:flagellar hook assembly protein FlgD [Pseudomonadota bacterium]MBU1639948.1 flagellar hook assembly protein FlgD [Pseudomonadota bacterium]